MQHTESQVGAARRGKPFPQFFMPHNSAAVCVRKTKEARVRLQEMGRKYSTVNGYYIIHVYPNETKDGKIGHDERQALLLKLGLTVAQRPLRGR
jgi:hypothetical protein